MNGGALAWGPRLPAPHRSRAALRSGAAGLDEEDGDEAAPASPVVEAEAEADADAQAKGVEEQAVLTQWVGQSVCLLVSDEQQQLPWEG